MALPQHLLDKLICPNCGNEELEYRQAEDRLNCPRCNFVYRVTEDVPVLLVDEAEQKE
ncbi:Trm112 family protein [candidate division GN15 bacterium]|nr:Trm112 family protein [candidate division GN15 bacterium]